MTATKAQIWHRTVNAIADLKTGALALVNYQWGIATDDDTLVCRDGAGVFHEFIGATKIIEFIDDAQRVLEPVSIFAQLPATPSVGDLCMTLDNSRYYKFTSDEVWIDIVSDAGAPYPFEDVKDVTGWVDNKNVLSTYDEDARVFIISHLTKLSRRMKGIETEYGSNEFTTQPHPLAPPASNIYFKYFDEVTELETESSTAWEFEDSPIGAVYWVPNLAYVSAPDVEGWWVPLREVHGVDRSPAWHRDSHFSIGTTRYGAGQRGAEFFDYTPGSTSDNKPGISTVDLLDEDLRTTVDEFASGGGFTLYGLSDETTVGSFGPELSADIVHRISGVPQYQNADGSFSPIGNNDFANCWVFAQPVCLGDYAQKWRFFILQPQNEYNFESQAEEENPRSLNLGNLREIAPEFILAGQAIIKRSGSSVSIEQFLPYYGSRESLVQTPGSGTVDWANVSNTPTTLLGYGITDAYTKTESDLRFLGIGSTAVDSDMLGGQLPSYYFQASEISNYYTKTESDGKYQLQSEMGDYLDTSATAQTKAGALTVQGLLTANSGISTSKIIMGSGSDSYLERVNPGASKYYGSFQVRDDISTERDLYIVTNSGRVLFGSSYDTTLSRLSANHLTTPGAFTVGGLLTANGGISSTGDTTLAQTFIESTENAPLKITRDRGSSTGQGNTFIASAKTTATASSTLGPIFGATYTDATETDKSIGGIHFQYDGKLRFLSSAYSAKATLDLETGALTLGGLLTASGGVDSRGDVTVNNASFGMNDPDDSNRRFNLGYDNTADQQVMTARNDDGSYRDIVWQIDRATSGSMNLNRTLNAKHIAFANNNTWDIGTSGTRMRKIYGVNADFSGSISEGGTSLVAKYLGLGATAKDSLKLNGQSASYYLDTSSTAQNKSGALTVGGLFTADANLNVSLNMVVKGGSEFRGVEIHQPQTETITSTSSSAPTLKSVSKSHLALTSSSTGSYFVGLNIGADGQEVTITSNKNNGTQFWVRWVYYTSAGVATYSWAHVSSCRSIRMSYNATIGSWIPSNVG